jgi:photosystem II stability/assembly factor-like uncharacterized protein
MIACLSPNGQNTSRGTEPPTRLLVATVTGISVLEREGPATAWTDRGRTLDGHHCSSVLIEPRRGGIFAGMHDGGLYFSGDAGRTWEPRTNGLTIEHVFSVAYAHVGAETVLYAGTEPASMFRSDDYGASWVEQTGVKESPGREKWMFPGKPNLPHVKSIAIDPRDQRIIYALVEQGALLKTTDGGATWRELDGYSKPEDENYRDVHQLLVHPGNSAELFLTTGMGMYHSLDAGETWDQYTDRSFRIGYPDHIIVSPLDGDTMFISGAMRYPGAWRKEKRADPTVMKSLDRARSWTDASVGLYEDRRANIEAVSIAEYPGGFTLFAGNTDGEVFATSDGALTWSRIASGLGPVSKVYHFRNLMPV